MHSLRVIPVKQEGLAHISYFVVSDHEAVVIDPRRDADIYFDMAAETGSKIVWVLETHRNEDYVIGSLEIQDRSPSTTIGHSDKTEFKYGESLRDGEQITVSQMKITCINTPGHTDDSMCYLMADTSVSEDPIVCFTGDTLFVGNVGRTDLVDRRLTEKMARRLYASIHETLLELDDGVIIYPGHGAGSVCGGEMAEREFSTIGYERKHNKWLQFDEEDFVDRLVRQELALASYFKHCERLNTIGPPLLKTLPLPTPLSSHEFETMMQQSDTVVVDTRSSEAFASCHISNSISIPLSLLGLIAGWVVRPDENILLVLDRNEDLNDAYSYLIRLGLDRVRGYLRGGFTDWVSNGMPTGSLKTALPRDLQRLVEEDGIRLLDVREAFETQDDPVQDATHIPLTRIRDDPELPQGGSFVTVCGIGQRSTTASSILKRQGAREVWIVQGGIKAIREKK